VREVEYRPITSVCWSAEHRLADMDADGIDRQVVSPTPLFFGYERSVDEAVKVARIFNDLTLVCVAEGGDRLIPFCQVPLQDPDAACAELDRCLAAGHAGVEIGNHVGERDLDDDGVVEFLQHCAAVGAPVFVHPWDMASGPRLDRWMSRWLSGMPAETHLSVLAMILGGVFDRLPPTLQVCFAHGGGSCPFWLGRLDNAWHRRGELVRGRSVRPPSEYVDRFFVDSVVFHPAALRLLVDVVGEDRVLVGSDYPYPLGERPAGRVVREADFLTEPQREKLLSTNALRYLGLSPSEC
jgi:aminocarboxymuconate-semialdehyde decarboxylase